MKDYRLIRQINLPSILSLHAMKDMYFYSVLLSGKLRHKVIRRFTQVNIIPKDSKLYFLQKGYF